MIKIKIKTSDLLKATNSAYKAIGSSPVLPILSNFKIEVMGDVMSITATDLELTIQEKIPCVSKVDVAFTFPAKMLIDTVKEIKEEELIIEVGETQATIRIEKVKGAYSSPIQQVNDFPQTPDVEIEKSINSDQLQKAISKVFFALGTDDLRPAMTGVLVEVGGNQTTVVATDAHVLSRYVINEKNDFEEGSFIIPRKAASIIKEMKGTIQLSFAEKNVKAVYENTTIICRLIDARYPDYRAVIPVDNPNEIILQTSELKGALKRVKLYANQKTNLAIFKIGEVTQISSQDTDFGNEAVEQLTGELNGDPMTIGYNGKIVLSCLDNISGESVEISYSSPMRAAIITEGDLTMLLMPVAMN